MVFADLSVPCHECEVGVVACHDSGKGAVATICGANGVEEPGPALFDNVVLAIFLSLPLYLASLLQIPDQSKVSFNVFYLLKRAEKLRSITVTRNYIEVRR